MMNGFQRSLVLEAQDNDDKLSAWEIDFISSLAEKDERFPEMDLSEKQNKVLNRIGQKFA